jgi:KipI family sensor histidine kinase inhibitor
MDRIFRIYPAGDAALIIEMGRQIDLQINRQVHHLAGLLTQAKLPGIGEAVPAYASLLVHYDPAVLDYAAARRWIEERASQLDSAPVSDPRRVDIPTVYGGKYGPDLAFLAEYHHIPVETAIQLHSSAVYTVYMMGFTPGFPYLGELPEGLATPRLESPRTRVPAGSVGIAGSQTGVYPIDSPGGWRIIGYTPLRLFEPQREPPALLAAGDQVRFIPISPQDLPDAS